MSRSGPEAHTDTRNRSSDGARRLSDWALRVRLPWLSRFAALFAIAIAVFGLAVDRIARTESEEHLRSDLESALASHETVVQTWANGVEAAVAEAAREPSLVAEARELEPLRDRPEALRGAPATSHIRERLRPITGDIRSTEFVILDADGFCTAAYSDDHLGGILSPALRPWLEPALTGQTRMTPPLWFPVLTAPGSALHAEPTPATLVSAPIVDDGGHAGAVLVFVVSLEPTLTRLLSTWQLENQGAETYAFDRDGRQLTASKHRDTLEAAGNGTVAAGGGGERGLLLRDPGGDLLAGYRPATPAAGWPLVHPVAMALSGQPGFDVHGYRNHVGRWMVGAWKWLEPYGFGIATERDRDAVYRHHRVPRFAISMASGIALASAIGGLISSWVFARLARGDTARAVGPYELIERVGVGAMGEVYLAQHALLRRPTAVKLIHSDRTGPTAARRFESEVATTASLSHPNTISIYDYGRTTDGTLYFAMEYLRGFTVGRMIERFGAVPESRALLILTRVAAALSEAHGIGFVHGDVSSQNVMLCKVGGIADFVKLLDFGLARRADESKHRADDDVVGTPAFMAPEVFDHSRPIGPASDIYAIGALGYYLVTGHAPFELANAFAIYEAHLREPVPRPSERAGHAIDAALENVLLRCLEKDPAARPASVAELEEELRRCSGFGAWTLADAARWWSEHASALLPTLASLPSAEEELTAARAKTVALVRPA